ncbi:MULTISPECIES: tail fiber assembly protein [Dickeya]|uniref:Tail fiber assembly protein n=1 Tax=Dickeya aquatica TaxID=1401087 RepID=A0A375AA84_9GAMM|nr:MULTISPECIES: tail fiber assembly protein [Dickeya]SLM62816.1 Tail fiber assembly protein [Dickeya aquatica]
MQTNDIAVLGENGLASNTGWLTVYHADTQTGEYGGSSEEYLMTGTGVPAHSYADAPPADVASGQAVRRTADGVSWEVVADFRGQTAYDTRTRQPQVIGSLGDLPKHLTLLPPASEFDCWQDDAWVTDTAAQHAATVLAAQRDLDARRQAARERISELTYAEELAMATETETRLLKEWKRYLVQLGRIDTAAAPDIDWPATPA